MRLINFAVLIVGLCISSASFGHARWALDGLVKPRTDANGIKTGPCGAARTTNRVTELVAGSKVQVKFESVIFHSGVFKIYFSPANDANFVLLADNIKDYANQPFQTYTLSLPNQPCDACTLQLIQTMPDSGNSLYYSCADIRLVKPASSDTTAPAPVTNLKLNADTQSISLNWQNPSQDYAQTLVVQSTAPLSDYPLTGVEYQTAGKLGNGTIVLLAAQTSFQTKQLESGQTYYFTLFNLDTSRNYSKLAEISGQLAQLNHVPSVSLVAEQAGQIKQRVSTAGGVVTVQAKVSDADNSDHHNLDWSGTDYRLLDLTANDAAFTFNPAGLKAGQYTVKVQATDSGTPALTAQAQLELSIEEPATTPAVAGSADGLEVLLLGLLCCLRRRRY
ncbi:MAG: SCE4755 family polysaccharide monooxygenase-like protein [Marinagarivorans sp.]